MSKEGASVSRASIQLAGVVLDGLHFTNHKVPVLAGIQWQAVVKVFGHQTDTRKELWVTARLTVTYPENEVPRPYDLTLTLLGQFHSDVALTDEQAQEFIAHGALSLMWPYLQETVSNITTRAGGIQLRLTATAPLVSAQ